MAEQLDFDFSLLDTNPSPGVEPTLVDDSATVPPPVVESLEEAAPTVAPATDGPSPLPAEEDDFDYSAPLTPRERILMERLEKMTGERLDAATSPVAVATSPVLSEKNFLESITDLDEVFSSPENFNKLLLAVHNNALEEASKLTAERILSNLPQVMSQYVTQHLSMNKLVDDFYTANADLAPMKRTVTAVANEVSAEHPEYTTQQVFDETAKRTRSILKLQQIPVASPQRTTKPAFVPPKGSRSRVGAPVLSDIERGVLELIT